jgi:hypothetical protein
VPEHIATAMEVPASTDVIDGRCTGPTTGMLEEVGGLSAFRIPLPLGSGLVGLGVAAGNRS